MNTKLIEKVLARASGVSFSIFPLSHAQVHYGRTQPPGLEAPGERCRVVRVRQEQPVVGDGHVGVHEVADTRLHLLVVNHAPPAVVGEGVALFFGEKKDGGWGGELTSKPVVYCQWARVCVYVCRGEREKEQKWVWGCVCVRACARSW